MTRARVLQEVRPMRFEARYERRQRRTLMMEEAAAMLGITERTFRRWSGRYDTEGVEGLQDRRIGRASARAVPVDDVVAMVALYQTRYTGWTVKHFHERWQQEHGGTRAYRWTKKTLQAAGQVTRAPRRGAHRKKRPRTPLPGMMLHQDGSTHEWVPGCQWDVIVTLDDATTEIYSAFFVEEAGTLSSFHGLQEVIGTKGLFSFLYADRGSHDRCNPTMILSAFTTVEMSSWLRDCRPSHGGPDGQRGQGHHACEGTQAGVCDSPDEGAAADAGPGGHRVEADASGTGHALEPTDPSEGQGHGAAAVCAAVGGFWTNVGSRDAGRAPRDHAQRRDPATVAAGARDRVCHTADAAPSGVAGAQSSRGGTPPTGRLPP